jgi:hypothetical protein
MASGAPATTLSPTEQFCARLRSIVELLENGDHASAAKVARDIQRLVARLPPEMPDEEVEEASRLLDRYGRLGEGLRQETLAAMRQLGAGRRLAAYVQTKYRP